MDDISNLIKEAKPLYFARKRRNRRIKTVLAAVVFVCLFGRFMPVKYDNAGFVWEAEVSQAIAQVEDGSVIEDMGLPVDEYGLLMVG